MDSRTRRVIASVWEARFAIESEASARFGVLARRLQASGAPEPVWSLAGKASSDETRHAAHCQTYLAKYGGATPAVPQHVIEYAPSSLSPEQRLLYEVVAQCCLAETQSTTTLVTLLEEVETPPLRAVLQELARDEVGHGRLGWAYLAWARERLDVSFLSALLPAMVEGGAGEDLFSPPAPEADLPELLKHGVVPATLRRELYTQTVTEVIFPGLRQYGVDTTPAEAWLTSR